MDQLARIARLDRIRNEEVKQIIDTKGFIVEDISRKQLILYGHVERMNSNRLQKKNNKMDISETNEERTKKTGKEELKEQ